MACPVCGNPNPCNHERLETDPANSCGEQSVSGARDSISYSFPTQFRPVSVSEAPFDDSFWRDEVVSRVQQHRARRRKRLDSQAALELDFQAESDGSEPRGEPQQAALNQPRRKLDPRRGIGERRQIREAREPKIIRFPGPLNAPPSTFDDQSSRQLEPLELAEPILRSPRILDAPEPPPEQMALLPLFADIKLEAQESRSLFELEVPPRPAAFHYRLFADFVDAMIVTLAVALFTICFLLLGGGLPKPRPAIVCGLLVSSVLWLIYQYLFLVYSRKTPGMRLTQLELLTFKGEPVSLSLRRWRALACVLSALALGLGYAWALVDEDGLGWHDRMTQTHVKQRA